jgi:hypothetical protein
MCDRNGRWDSAADMLVFVLGNIKVESLSVRP